MVPVVDLTAKCKKLAFFVGNATQVPASLLLLRCCLWPSLSPPAPHKRRPCLPAILKRPSQGNRHLSCFLPSDQNQAPLRETTLTAVSLMMVSCLGRRATAVAAAAAAAVALALLSPVAVVAFVQPGAAWSTLPTASSSRSSARLHNSVASLQSRPIGCSRREQSANGRWCRIRGGVASLRAEVLPEGGVSPCVIKVRLT